MQGPQIVYVEYAHLGDIYVRKDDELAPGDIIASVMRSNKAFPCMGNIAHLHMALTLTRHDPGKKPLNPNLFWKRGPGRVTCYSASDKYDPEKLELVSPLPCRRGQKLGQTKKAAFERAVAVVVQALEAGDADHVADMQAFLKKERFYRGKIDGKYGPKTYQAVVRCVQAGKC